MKQTYIIAGGGTGGHIYPGIAIARAIQKINPEAQIRFVGSRGGLEEKIIPREGFTVDLVSVGRLHKSVSLTTKIKTLFRMPLAIFQCVKILFSARPSAVLGVGGFASGPMLLVAAIFGYRTYIWEPNAMPGMTNRWLSRFVTKNLLVFEEAKKYLASKKTQEVGIPVRFSLGDKTIVSSEKLKVLIFGGSQGARGINQVVFKMIASRPKRIVDEIELIHQTGPNDYAEALKVYANAPAGFQCFEYLHDMKERYQWCDIVIARSGASTVAEVISCRKAAVFIPLPSAADDHQRKNAEVLARKNAAEMILQKDFDEQKLIAVIEDFLDHREKISQFSKSVQKFEFAKADEQIAHILMGPTV